MGCDFEMGVNTPLPTMPHNTALKVKYPFQLYIFIVYPLVLLKENYPGHVLKGKRSKPTKQRKSSLHIIAFTGRSSLSSLFK